MIYELYTRGESLGIIVQIQNDDFAALKDFYTAMTNLTTVSVHKERYVYFLGKRLRSLHDALQFMS